MTREIARRLPLHRQVVPAEWIDYNGHMSEGYYSLAFGLATDAMMDATGLHAAYREATGCSLYTVEGHLRYLRDVTEGAHLAVRTRVLGVHGKKAHFAHEMYVVDGAAAEPARDTVPVATTELLALHVDQELGRAVPFPDTVRERLAEFVEPAPEWAGRAVAPVGGAAG
ncbi:thioesterase family protein [Streptomyces aureocirculatus]|uniref:thioesterase family protein n=1 Tax=Streptomyces aureocirculatus TaxID=67275 RepID=UPI0004C9D140|nr:thioesterase family protein [Streptomyces aureocirculatus]